ncbi:helix-turn-helix transcriptional regulator [Paenibacillus pinihumi]|uniref:helix-turn-helix transcriptional regulator n=1 Tax=Paenibacillus pinihumi TaxID=669462 RepID=UPI0004111C44|nr:AraC family transcriptional regulator [Paenibacillus pinihumi]
MECLLFVIPPLPQFITVGHTLWKPGSIHFERTFQVYDMLFVRKGTLYMREDGVEYAIGPNRMLIMEAGRNHVGSRPCMEDTEIFWIHFMHPGSNTRIEDKHIAWSTSSHREAEHVERPAEQNMYLPKFARFEPGVIIPLLQSMLHDQNRLSAAGALNVQVLLSQLFAHLQETIISGRESSRTYQICCQVERCLQERIYEPFSAERLQQELGLNLDYLTRCLKEHTGLSPVQYVNDLRMEEAKRLLVESELSIPEIAERVAIPDYNYFIRRFRSHVGQPPGLYRRRKRGFV